MTDVGSRADLSAHALGRLLVSSPVILSLLTTRDVRHLRRADTALRSIVAEYPWSDPATAVHNLAQWRSSFPAATAAAVHAGAITKPQLARLSGLTDFSVLGFRRKVKPADELPLAYASSFPRLEVLRVKSRDHVRNDVARVVLPPSAAAWRELGGLRELTLELPRACFPADLLSHVRGLRKLSLAGEVQGSSPCALAVSDASLARLPELEELRLCGVPFSRDFSGACFGQLPRLALLSLRQADLPPRATLPPKLVSLSVMWQGHLSSEALAPLGSLKSLELQTHPDYAVGGSALQLQVRLSSAAFLGLTQLESLELASGVVDGGDFVALLSMLNGFGRLRRLGGTAISSDSYVLRLSACPITTMHLHLGRLAVVKPAAFLKAFPGLRTLRVISPQLTASGIDSFASWSDLRSDHLPFTTVSGLWVRTLIA